MGVKKLNKFLSNHHSHVFHNALIKNIPNVKKVGIDISIYIYKWYSISIKHSIKTSTGKLINHLQGLVYMIKDLLENDLTPIFVFDGVKPQIKDTSTRVCPFNIPSNVYVECIELLKVMNINYIIAPAESDEQLAVMARSGVIDAVISEDLDLLMRGTPILITQYKVKGTMRFIILDQVLKSLNFNLEEFQKLCVLFGTDYNKGIQRKNYKEIIEIVRSGEKIHKNHINILETIRNPKAEWISHYNDFRVIDVANMINYLNQKDFDEKKLKQLGKTFSTLNINEWNKTIDHHLRN